MAQYQKSRNSEGVCEKIYSAFSPLRASIHRISHHPNQSQASISATTGSNPPAQVTNNPAKTSPPLIKPVHIVHQPNLSKTIPIEFEPSVPNFSPQKNKKPKDKEDSADKREIVIVTGESNDQKGTASRKDLAQEAKKSIHASMERTKSQNDDEGKFSDYISKVKNRMMRTMTNFIGDGKPSATTTRRDSFNDDKW